MSEEKCLHCDEPIASTDKVEPTTYVDLNGDAHARHHHIECFLRIIFGSVGHQRRECHCYGGEGTGDPEGLSTRDAARAAVAHHFGEPTPTPWPPRRHQN